MSTSPTTVRIWHENLAVMVGNERHLLLMLTADSRIFGSLCVAIAGRLVPGFSSSRQDVSFGRWLRELRQAAQALAQPGGGRHTFDEGFYDEGLPAFLWERVGERGYFSIVASEVSDGGEELPDWQRVEFIPDDFVAAHAKFRQSFLADIRRASFAAGDWLARCDPQGGG